MDLPVVVVDGWIKGVWKHDRSAGSIEITVQPFDRLSTSQRKKIGAESDRLGHFLNAPAVVEFVGRLKGMPDRVRVGR
jgi:hypothetical protein